MELPTQKHTLPPFAATRLRQNINRLVFGFISGWLLQLMSQHTPEKQVKGSSGCFRFYQTPQRIRRRTHTSINTKFQLNRPPHAHKYTERHSERVTTRWIFMRHNRRCPAGGRRCCPPGDTNSRRCRVGEQAARSLAEPLMSSCTPSQLRVSLGAQIQVQQHHL